MDGGPLLPRRIRAPGASVVAGARLRRWALVAVLAVLAVVAPAVIASRPVSLGATPPPDEMRARIAGSDRDGWSGYAESGASLGLPSLGALSDVTSLLGGTTRMRAWYAAPDSARVDELSVTGERDRYTTPAGQAVWDYGANLLTQIRRDPAVRLPRADDLLPPQLARRLLSGTTPTDPASALPPRRVAGVTAAGMRVTVTDPRTRVGTVDVWADPVSGLPVAVEVTGRGAAGPSLVTRFLELTQGPPDPAALVPRRGPGAGQTSSPTSDLFGVFGRGAPRLVPAVVDGVRREPPQRGFAATGKYGTTLSQLIVVPLPQDVSGTLLGGLSRAGSRARTIDLDAGEGAPDAQAAAVESPLLALAVVRTPARSWAVAGLVTPDVLDRAVRNVAGSVDPPGGQR